MKYIICLVAFIALVIWMAILQTEINMNIGSYFIYSSADKLLILFAIIFTPIYIIRKILKGISYKIKQHFYISNVISFIKSIKNEKDKNSVIEILKHSENTSFIKQTKEISNLIAIKKYDKAIIVINKTKVKNYNESLLLKYLCISYKEKNDLANFIIYAKKGISLKKDALWFLGEIFDLSFKTKSLNSEIVYLFNALKSIKNTNEIEYKKYFCLINYFYTNFLYSTDIEKAKGIAKKTIKNYPDFAPIYELLFKIYTLQNKERRFNDLLKNLWKANKSYEVILLWQKYYKEKNENKILSDINSYGGLKEENDLLIAGIYSNNDKFLEAQNLLQNIKTTSIAKTLVELDIMQKENNFKTANKIIMEFLATRNELNFWNSYIN